MDCKSIKNEDLAERYLHHRLNEGDTDSFETHLLECPRCRRELELLQAAQADLTARAHEIRTWTPAKPFFLRWQAMGVTALVVVVVAGAVAGTFFFRGKKTEKTLTVQHVPAPPGPTNTQTPEKPKQVTVDGADAVDNAVNGVRDKRFQEPIEDLTANGRNYQNFNLKDKGASKKRDITPTIGPAPNSGLSVGGARSGSNEVTRDGTRESEAQPSTEVAQLKPSTPVPTKEPPNKETPTLTAAQGVELYYLGSTSAPAFTFSGFTSKEQTAEGGDVSSHSQPSRSVGSSRTAFRDAMNAYIDGNYSEAAERLDQAAVKEPGALDVQFYLGICRLLIGQPQRAIEPLKNAAKASSPTVQQQVHYYLAKTYVQSLQLQEAEDEFRIASQMTGPLKNDAGNMLRRLQTLRGQLGKD